jgi:uncharacterized protein (DUF4415 family)
MANFEGILAILGQDGAFPTWQGVDPVDERMRTIAQERHYVKMVTQLQDLEIEARNAKLKGALIPSWWSEIEARVPVRPRKTKLTARFDTEVVKWFQGMGHGYQARMNAVLRTYMLALLSKEILGRGDKDWKYDEIWGKPAPKQKE